MQNAYQMVLFLKNVFPRYLWGFWLKIRKFLKVEKIEIIMKKQSILKKKLFLLEKRLYQNGKEQNIPVVAGRLVH